MVVLIIVVLIIVLTCWLKRNDWFLRASSGTPRIARPITTTPPTTPSPTPTVGGTTPTITTTPRAGFFDTAFKSIGLFAACLVLLWLAVNIRGCHKWWNEPSAAQLAAQYANAHPATTKALILRFDGFTPCDTPIDFAFELDTQGDPVDVIFPGIPTPVHYSGKGVMSAPEKRGFGNVHITSSDSQKQARCKISEVVLVPAN